MSSSGGSRYMQYSPSPSTGPHSPHIPGIRSSLVASNALVEQEKYACFDLSGIVEKNNFCVFSIYFCGLLGLPWERWDLDKIWTIGIFSFSFFTQQIFGIHPVVIHDVRYGLILFFFWICLLKIEMMLYLFMSCFRFLLLF